jgi:hypothetical protein
MYQFKLYRQEIYNFLKTITIKFDKLGQLRNLELSYSGYEIDKDDRTQWPYYINMIGEYHSSNTMMEVYSIDTDEVINFTKENLISHPKTAALYKVGLPKYKELEKLYPNQIDLIKSIVYPVSDINLAIDAEEFSLLRYDITFLDHNERHSLIEHIKNFLQFNCSRWYIQEFGYEELYPIAFYALVWYNLALSLFSKRIKNLHTPSVHTFHIWEYLTSKGLGDYRDILTNKQALFLYRNINYILKNRGKESTLSILAENILKQFRISIVGKKVYHSVADVDDCRWYPEILSDQVVDYTDDTISKVDTTEFETITNIQRRLYNIQFDNKYSLDYVQKVTSDLSNTRINILPTKLLELKKYTIDNKYENLLIKFSLDTLITRYVYKKLNFNIDWTDTVSGIEFVNMPIGDALALLYYAQHRYMQQVPTTLPIRYTTSSGYVDFSRPTDMPSTFGFDGNVYQIKNYIHVNNLLDEIVYKDIPIDQSEMMDLIGDQFDTLISHILIIRNSSNRLVHKSLSTVYDRLIQNKTIPIKLSEYTNYGEWIASSINISSLITTYNNLPIPEESYGQLASSLIELLIPLTKERFNKYLSVSDSDNSYVYTKLKNLFVQLCSYNVAFLNTNRECATYFFLSNLPIDDHDIQTIEDMRYIDPTYTHFDDITLSKSDILVDYDPTILDLDMYYRSNRLDINTENGISISDKCIDPILIVDPLDVAINNQHYICDELSIDLSLDTQFKTLGE